MGGVGGSASGVVQTGKGRKVRANVGGASEARARVRRREERVSGTRREREGRSMEGEEKRNEKKMGTGNQIYGP